MVLSKRDVVVTGSALLISQYVGKPRMEAVVSASLSIHQKLDDAIVDVESLVLNLDSAQGNQLDICGSILDEERVGRPDFIYRRLLKTKVEVLRSQGRIEDLLTITRTFQDLFLSGARTPDNNSELYLVSPSTRDGSGNPVDWEGREIEISIFPEDDNLYTDPKPFAPDAMHDLLLDAKGAGEKLQSIYPIVAPNDNPRTDSFRFKAVDVNNAMNNGDYASISVANSFGSIYSTGSAGFSNFGGTLGHRRQQRSTFTANAQLVNIEAPTIAPASGWFVGGTFAVTAGLWAGLPESFEYTLLRDGSAVTGMSGTTLSTIKGYKLTSTDLSSSWQLRETAVSSRSSRGNVVALSKLNWAPYAIYDDANLVGHWNFLNAWWLDSTGAIRQDTENAIIGQQWYLMPNHVVAQPDAVWLRDDTVGDGLIVTKSNGKFTGLGEGAELMTYTDSFGTNLGVVYTQPYDVLVVYRPQTTSGVNYIIGGETAVNSVYMSYDATSSPNTLNVFAGDTIENMNTINLDKSALWLSLDENNGETHIWTNNDLRDGQEVTDPVGNDDFPMYGLAAKVRWAIPNATIEGDTLFGEILEVAIRTGSLSNQDTRDKWASYIKHTWGFTVTSSVD